ncbi:hypothetical protein BDN71DRAFT_1518881 [Pleurotus eryngii]|uniref:Uncharacterized protein n=1 Tax=Pleurotus eryngii TaxID=5323 RepID=A0A9P6D3J4_PLEER|nr:hypothetical protein BDN71DRAFT_1518881 [Pleurotus eryngii]
MSCNIATQCTAEKVHTVDTWIWDRLWQDWVGLGCEYLDASRSRANESIVEVKEREAGWKWRQKVEHRVPVLAVRVISPPHLATPTAAVYHPGMLGVLDSPPLPHDSQESDPGFRCSDARTLGFNDSASPATCYWLLATGSWEVEKLRRRELGDSGLMLADGLTVGWWLAVGWQVGIVCIELVDVQTFSTFQRVSGQLLIFASLYQRPRS